jgi:hypothetical protein
MPYEERLITMSRRIDDIEGSVHGQVRELGGKLDKHNGVLEAHIAHFQAHEADEIQRHQQFLDSQTKNTEAITDLTKSVSGVVEAYETANSVGKFIRWISGIVIAAASVLIYAQTMGPS